MMEGMAEWQARAVRTQATGAGPPPLRSPSPEPAVGRRPHLFPHLVGLRSLVLDVYSRMIFGWQLATHMRTDLPLDALEIHMRLQY